MQYGFSDILSDSLYKTSEILFIFGRYNYFNALVSDECKDRCIDRDRLAVASDINILDEFFELDNVISNDTRNFGGDSSDNSDEDIDEDETDEEDEGTEDNGTESSSSDIEDEFDDFGSEFDISAEDEEDEEDDPDNIKTDFTDEYGKAGEYGEESNEDEMVAEDNSLEDILNSATTDEPKQSTFVYVQEEDKEEKISTSVDFGTFLNVVSVPNINGKWYCKIDYSSLKNAKDKEKLSNYMKAPSKNGVLVVTCTDWKDARYLKNNKLFKTTSNVNSVSLDYPQYETLKKIVKMMFKDKGIEIDTAAVDFFITRMNKAYDEYEDVLLKRILVNHEEEKLTLAQIKNYMKGIEYYEVDQFIAELTRPLSSDLMNNKKVLRMLVALEDAMGAKSLAYKVLGKAEEMIGFRVLINNGLVPIGIKYFYKDVIAKIVESGLGNVTKQSKNNGDNDSDETYNIYEKMTENQFRRKADLASRTSLRDWTYIKMILMKAIDKSRVSADEADKIYQRALYDVCVRSVLTESRINNILGLDNILDYPIHYLDNLRYLKKD